MTCSLDCSVQMGNGKWKAHCPCHEDQHRSLGLWIGNNGNLLIRCFCDCGATYGGIIKALGLTASALYPNVVGGSVAIASEMNTPTLP